MQVLSNRLSWLSGQNVHEDGATLYQKHELVGKGAYGAVFRATEKATGQVVALKASLKLLVPVGMRVLNTRTQVIDLDHEDNDDMNELQKEVALLSQLRDAASNNITLYHGCWISGELRGESQS